MDLRNIFSRDVIYYHNKDHFAKSGLIKIGEKKTIDFRFRRGIKGSINPTTMAARLAISSSLSRISSSSFCARLTPRRSLASAAGSPNSSLSVYFSFSVSLDDLSVAKCISIRWIKALILVTSYMLCDREIFVQDLEFDKLLKFLIFLFFLLLALEINWEEMRSGNLWNYDFRGHFLIVSSIRRKRL